MRNNSIKNLVLFFLVLVVAGSITIAQTSTGKLTGSVVKASNGKPVAYALVAVIDENWVEVARHRCGADGRFVISVKPGTYTLRISLSQKSMEVPNVVVQSNQATEMGKVSFSGQ